MQKQSLCVTVGHLVGRNEVKYLANSVNALPVIIVVAVVSLFPYFLENQVW